MGLNDDVRAVMSLYYYFMDKNWMVYKTDFGNGNFTLSIYNKIDNELNVVDISLMYGEWRH